MKFNLEFASCLSGGTSHIEPARAQMRKWAFLQKFNRSQVIINTPRLKIILVDNIISAIIVRIKKIFSHNH
jgi:hypothetical protein